MRRLVQQYSHEQRKRAILLITITLTGFLVYMLRGFVNAFLGAIIIYTLLRQFNHYLIRKRGWSAGWTALLMMSLSLLVMVLPLSWVVYQVSQKVILLSQNKALFREMLQMLENTPLASYIDTANLMQEIQKLSDHIFGFFSYLLNNLLEIFTQLVMMYFLLFFMFSGYKYMETWLIRYLPFSRKNTIAFAKELKMATYNNVLGQGIISVAQGGLVGVSFWIFGVPDPLLYSMVAMFASFIPVVGAALVFVPGALYMLALGQSWEAAGIVLWGFLLVANIDNLLRLYINKLLGDVHPLVTFLGIFVGLPAFGLVGLVVGPLLVSCLILLLKIYNEQYLFIEQEKPEPVEESREIF